MRLLCAEAAMLALARRSILIAAMLLTYAALARADDPVAPADAAAIRQVIQGQMNAFKVDDWKAAFAYASPSIQTKFESPQIFSQMVTQAYQPVYRPRGVEFREVKASEFGPTQEVFVVGPDGLSYLAYYTMEKQADGSWRISGCYLVRAEDESV
jgi:ketosteroid isomerase-like protein